MSTGNFSTAEEIFTLPGVGNQEIDLTLNYNAQSGEDSPVGHGWQFAYGSHLQQYSDGASWCTCRTGEPWPTSQTAAAGSPPAGAFATLTPAGTTFVWSTRPGPADLRAGRPGRGMLTATEDRQGNTETLAYDGIGRGSPA